MNRIYKVCAKCFLQPKKYRANRTGAPNSMLKIKTREEQIIVCLMYNYFELKNMPHVFYESPVSYYQYRRNKKWDTMTN